MKNLLLVALLTTTLFACKSNTINQASFDLEQAKNEIIAANQGFADYLSKGDSVGLATNCYTIDGKFMHPNAPIADGRKAIISAVSGIMNTGIKGIKFTTTQVWGDANNITEEGAFDLMIADGSVVEKGKYLVLWTKEDGKWKIHRDCFNSNSPLQTK